jgi:putative PIN family toxin of toxin-antitoxin system
MRLVVDTSVIIKAVRNFNGASAALIQEAVRQRVSLLVSTPLWLEYESAVKRPEHWVWPGFGAVEAERFLGILANVATPVEIRFRWRGLLPDPDDDLVLETAINGGADALVTFNERDFAPGAKQLGLEMCLPNAILAVLKDRP